MHLKKFLDQQDHLTATEAVIAYLEADLVPLANEWRREHLAGRGAGKRAQEIERAFAARRFALALKDDKAEIGFAPDRPASMTPGRPTGPTQSVAVRK